MKKLFILTEGDKGVTCKIVHSIEDGGFTLDIDARYAEYLQKTGYELVDLRPQINDLIKKYKEM